MAAPDPDLLEETPDIELESTPEDVQSIFSKPRDASHMDPQILRQRLTAYLHEAQEARRAQPMSRDDVWDEGWRVYWGQYDWSGKEEWQSRISMPEAQNFVDRFAGQMRKVMVAADPFFEVDDLEDPNNRLGPAIRKIMEDEILGRSGTAPHGHAVGFPYTFAQAMKAGAIMNPALAVTWDPEQRRVRIDEVDAREVYLDPAQRRLYRVRRREVDIHIIRGWADLRDSQDDPIYDADAIEQVQAFRDLEDETRKRISAGHPKIRTAVDSALIDEYLCTLIDEDGEVFEKQLVVVANETQIIRGPESNPFWHEDDWLISTSLNPVPFSVYGRTYMEGWVALAIVFTELTNLVLDSAQIGAMDVTQAWPDLMDDPTKLAGGVHPGMTLLGDEGAPPGVDFVKTVSLGGLKGETIQAWRGIKSELQEGASASEIALGQVAPKSDVTATEIQASQAGASDVVENMVADTEETLLEPTLQVAWVTWLQHADLQDPGLRRRIGEENAAMLEARKEEFALRGIRFQVRGLRGLIQRAQHLRQLLGAINVIGSNELLTEAFQQRHDIGKLVDEILRGFGVDLDRLTRDAPRAPAVPGLPQPGGPGGGAGGAGGASLEPQVAPPAGGSAGPGQGEVT